MKRRQQQRLFREIHDFCEDAKTCCLRPSVDILVDDEVHSRRPDKSTVPYFSNGFARVIEAPRLKRRRTEIGPARSRGPEGSPTPFPSLGPDDDETEAPHALESSANLKAPQL